MSDSASAASIDVHPRLDEHERRAPHTLSVTNDFVEDVEVVDYESDTLFPAWDDEEGERRERRETRPARALRTICPFPDFSSPEGLDGAQRRQLEAAFKVALMRAHPRPVIDPRVDYGFRPADPAVEAMNAVAGPLRLHNIVITKDELAERKALRTHFLVPQEFPLEASGQICGFAEVASQTPTSFRSRDIPATSPGIGFDPGDNVVLLDVPHDNGRHCSHQESSVAGGDDRVNRRPVTRDDLRALEDEVLRDRSSAERHAKVTYRCADALDDLNHVVRRQLRLEDYRALSKRLLAVKLANASLHATVERLAPFDMEVTALCAQNQLLIQLLGGRGPVGSAPAPTLPRSLAPDRGFASMRITVILAVSAAGKNLPPILIWKGAGLVSFEKIDGVYVTYQKKAWVDDSLLKRWIDLQFPMVNVSNGKFLIWDSMRAHISKEVKAKCQTRDIKMCVIPGGLTPYLQAGDIGIY
ncbi:pogo transposable element with krab domain-like [Plasmopara halstedii]|uniref:Pogo transposable element with krab domain-like n=1 Tax=Plasmopara halstedii TaxID=4781 RepID=A0A0P1ADH7_PLAHL|nr:pogo transposable element with krab domain-like [Plasmopara halstedii]CEG39078.1 pogo transposable element with krab domain-like [Plasmopara halstedii]|eukprot:XP_024575447.1 pogo transposable element with krab domain-like [Plasmopara halstedii]